MKIKIDRRLYSDECISKAVYWFTDRYTISRSLKTNDIELIRFSPIANNIEEPDLEHTFLTRLNDFKLRQIVEKETHEIRTILYAKAFEKYID